MVQRYTPKKYQEKKIKEIEKNSDLEKKDNSEKNKNINEKNENKKTDIEKKLCKNCGKKMDKNHKSNILSDEEFENKKNEMEKVAYAKHLEDNLQKHLDISKKIEDKLREEFDIRDEMAGYRQGHHLISRTDIFFNNSLQAKIALSAGYEVNCMENGIILPSGTGIQGRNSEEDKDRVMKSTKRQLHCGHHDFRIEVNDRLSKEEYKKYPKQCYSTLVTNKFLKKMEKYERKCYLDETEKKSIIKTLNALSKEINDDIEKFEIEPKNCKYYVSRAAISYAFDIKEERYDFIEMVSTFDDENIVAKKYSIVADKKNIEILKKENYQGKLDIKFLKFCQDIVAFLHKEKLYLVEEKMEFIKCSSENYVNLFDNNRDKKYTYKEEIRKLIEEKGSGRDVREWILIRKKQLAKE